MKIILSPAKKMKTDTDSIGILSCPVFMEKTEEILSWLKGRTEEELQKMWWNGRWEPESSSSA